MLSRFVVIPALVVLVGAVGAAGWQTHRLTKSKALVRQLERVVAVRDLQIEAAERATRIAQEERDRFSEQAAEYNALREGLLEEGSDAPLPAWFAAYLERLFRDDP
jgi:predicted homoserine dehydrogenase-like protein